METTPSTEEASTEEAGTQDGDTATATTATAGRPEPETVLRWLAVVGVVVAVFVAIVGWRFLGSLDRNVGQSLEIGTDAAASVGETIELSADLIDSLDAGLAAIDDTLVAVDATATDTRDVAASTADLAAGLPDTFDEIDTALATVEDLSGTIDRTLRAASRIPLGPDYDPDVPLPDAIAGVRGAFEPIGQQLEAIADELDGVVTSSSGLGSGIGDIRAEIGRARDTVARSSGLLEDYRETTERVSDLAETSSDDLDSSIRWMRVALIALAAVLIAFQYVPWTMAQHLATRPRSTEPSAPADEPA